MYRQERRNLSMLFDFYEMTMSGGYFRLGMQDRVTYFDVFFRRVPDRGGFAIAAGLEQLVDHICDLHFDEEDIAYLRSKNLFGEDFLDYLRQFRFTGDIWAVPEGTPVFPGEPLVTVRAPASQAQLIETYALLAINHQSLIATKANRVVRAAQGRTVLEFGSRRAQGADGAIVGARAAYIGGVHGTACAVSDQLYGVPAAGTMAHSWVQMFDTQYEAFKTYCEIYPTNAVLLVDTYNTLKSGVPDAIRAFDEVLRPPGHHQVRHPSGLRRHRLPHQGGPQDAGRRRLGDLHHLRLQLPGRGADPGPAAAGGQDRLLRRGRADDHRPQRAGVRRRV